ncbi:MAG TPA: hypothetical protein PK210_12375 [Bacteroidia bacterium]|nr:hypothetical protein [Bacteroidia bacterium]
MGKGIFEAKSGEMALEKVHGQSGIFSAPAIGSSVMYSYIRD